MIRQKAMTPAIEQMGLRTLMREERMGVWREPYKCGGKVHTVAEVSTRAR